MSRRKSNSRNAQRNTFTETPCIIGLDQSYTRTGIAISVKGKVKVVKSVEFKSIKTKTMKREYIKKVLNSAIDTCLKKFTPEEITVICERVRTFTDSDSLRPAVIKAHSAMVATITDTAYLRGIKCYSVDTRAWKNAVLGDARPLVIPYPGVKDPKKIREIKYCVEQLGLDEVISYMSPKLGKLYNDDMADAVCISLYPFTGYPYKLWLED